MNIDATKLMALIEKSVTDTANGYWESEEIVIGNIDGVQISICCSKDEDDIVEEINPKHECVTN